MKKEPTKKPEAIRRTIINGIMKLLFMKKTHLSWSGERKKTKADKELPLEKHYEPPISDDDRREIAAEICKELDETGTTEGGENV